jgi:hypothetical protein
MSNVTKAKNWVELIKQIVQIITAMSVIVGIVFGLIELNKSRKELYVAVRILKLSTLQHQNRIFEQDRQIRHKRQEFVQEYKKIKAAGREQEYIQQLFVKHKTGRCVYLSGDLNAFSEVGRHYEYVGALVKLDYIDFPLVFEVLAFPDDFLDETQKLRQRIQDEWDGPGKRNKEFWKNFLYLRRLYREERKKSYLTVSNS